MTARAALSRRAFSRVALAAAATACARDDRLPPAPVASPTPSPTPATSGSAPSPPRLPALFHARPAFADKLAWLPVATLPSPVERAERLGRALGVDRLFVKRDDLSGKGYGGGKTRKLAFLLAHAKAVGAREIVTFGSIGSNQAVATALHGASLGFAVTIVLAPGPAGPATSDNLRAARRAGATFHLTRDGVAAAEARARVAEAGGGAHLIPSGGSTPLGNLAFVDAGLELAAQIADGDMPAPARVYVAMGTMGSAVGLSIGLALAGLSTEVVAVRTSSEATSSAARFAAMVRDTLVFARTIDRSFPDVAPRVRLVGTQLGAGYAHPTDASRKAVELAARHEGWRLEPVYTGKTLAALSVDEPKSGGDCVLFWLSHNSRDLVTSGVSAGDFPVELRRWVSP